MQYSHILWDFNGTVLDDVAIGIEAINLLLSRRGLKTLASREEYQRVFRFPIEEYYRAVGFDFSTDPYDVLAHEWVKEYRARERSAPLCPGVEEALRRVKEAGISQVLFSATQRTMLLEQLEPLGIGGYFDEVLGNDDIYAAGKTRIGQEWMVRVKPSKALLIGDTEHDARAAEAMGIGCVLVASGHQPPERLAATGCPVYPALGPELLKDLGIGSL